ncbi:hypothetical protein AY601_1139 [Pedobacter cryoconitis]|uniref:Uncharacterized protein n=1 Tax=Pedobacter cryoconitis TaxID=188932 RepID=A0A127V9P7_9SPHI|nr:hypothetical protein [Pedobacter cryoconitis]AMP98066.1 hypothetical protein AY601_1139 [Pedobacter cryoconitis]
MEYKIKLKDGTTKIIQILATTFKKLKVWKVGFDGKEFLLYKVGTEWMQRTEDYLEECYVISIGAYIDSLELN